MAQSPSKEKPSAPRADGSFDRRGVPRDEDRRPRRPLRRAMSGRADHSGPRGEAPPPADLAVVLTGGGARAAYQAGVLRGIARLLPATRFDIVTGVSAGAINASFLASRSSDLVAAVEELVALWSDLRIQDVFRV